MTYINGDILTVKKFSKVPALGPNIAAVDRPPHSAGGSSATTSQTHHSVVKRDEPCFVTNSILYTHELVHFVRDVQGDDDRKEEIEDIIIQMGITSDNFDLNQPSNLANCSRIIRLYRDNWKSFNPRIPHPNSKADNNLRQDIMDSQGKHLARRVDYGAACFTNPVYELVSLEPDHFLAYGAAMNIYDQKSNTFKSYVASPDRRLREFPGGTSCPSLPAFTFASERPPGSVVNPFLVVLNAEIKFRRYRRQTQLPPSVPLPDDVQQLVDLTIELVQLLYWRPVRAGKDGKDPEVVRRRPRLHRTRAPWPEDVDLETRMTIGQDMLAAGRDLPYDSDEEEFIKEKLSMPYPVGTPPVFRQRAELETSHQEMPPHV